MPSRQQHIEQPADPGPIGGRPEMVAGLGRKIVREFDPRQMPKQNAMGVQRALGRAGGAGCVDQQRRIIGRRVASLEVRPPALQCRPEAQCTRRWRVAVGDQDEPEVRQTVADGRDLVPVVGVGDQDRRATVVEAEIQRILAEQGEQRQGHQTGLVAGGVGQRRLQRLRQQDPDPFAFRLDMGGEHIGERIGPALDVVEAVPAGGAVGIDHRQCQTATTVGMAIDRVDSDIEPFGNLPAEAVACVLVVATADQHQLPERLWRRR